MGSPNSSWALRQSWFLDFVGFDQFWNRFSATPSPFEEIAPPESKNLRISDRKQCSSALKPLAIVLNYDPGSTLQNDHESVQLLLSSEIELISRFCGFGPDFLDLDQFWATVPPLPSRESLPRTEKSKLSDRKRCSSALKPLAFVLQPGFYIAKQPWIRPTPSELGGRAEFSICSISGWLTLPGSGFRRLWSAGSRSPNPPIFEESQVEQHFLFAFTTTFTIVWKSR